MKTETRNQRSLFSKRGRKEREFIRSAIAFARGNDRLTVTKDAIRAFGQQIITEVESSVERRFYKVGRWKGGAIGSFHDYDTLAHGLRTSNQSTYERLSLKDTDKEEIASAAIVHVVDDFSRAVKYWLDQIGKPDGKPTVACFRGLIAQAISRAATLGDGKLSRSVAAENCCDALDWVSIHGREYLAIDNEESARQAVAEILEYADEIEELGSSGSHNQVAALRRQATLLRDILGDDTDYDHNNRLKRSRDLQALNAMVSGFHYSSETYREEPELGATWLDARTRKQQVDIRRKQRIGKLLRELRHVDRPRRYRPAQVFVGLCRADGQYKDDWVRAYLDREHEARKKESWRPIDRWRASVAGFVKLARQDAVIPSRRLPVAARPSYSVDPSIWARYVRSDEPTPRADNVLSAGTLYVWHDDDGAPCEYQCRDGLLPITVTYGRGGIVTPVNLPDGRFTQEGAISVNDYARIYWNEQKRETREPQAQPAARFTSRTIASEYRHGAPAFNMQAYVAKYPGLR